MKRTILSLLFLFTIQFSFAQYIKGTVSDGTTKKPLKNVHVYIKNKEQVTLTNTFGKFRLNLSSQIKFNDTIFFSFIGYKTQKLIFSKNKKNYSVSLVKDALKLDNVALVWERKLKPRLHYKKLTPMKRGLFSFGSLLKDDKIYVIGGAASIIIDEMKKSFDYDPENFEGMVLSGRIKPNNFSREIYRGDLNVYDIKLDTWEVTDKMFRKRAFHNLNNYDNKIYVVGGKTLSMGRKYEYLENKIEIFDQDDKNIIIDDTNPHQAVDFASFTYKDKIIMMGGSTKMKKNGKREYSNKVHLYDLKSGLWYELATMPLAKETKGVLIDDKVYLLGGFNEKPLTEIESFDLISGKWKKEGDLFKGISTPAITHKDEMVYLYDEGKLVTFNIKTKELKQFLIDLDLKSSKLYYTNSKLYILGGFRENSYSTIPSKALYSIDLKEFETTNIHKSKKL